METLKIGQTGKLGNEILSIVSFNDMTFTCDNGKSYMIKNALWMTEGIETAAPKAKRAKKYNPAPENYQEEINGKLDVRDFDKMQQRARMNQRGSSLR